MANVAIIGCGLIGKKRAKYLDTTDKLIYAVDPNLKNAEELGCLAYKYYTEINPDKIDTVIVSTPNEYSVEIAKYFLSLGKKVLVEKPGAVSLEELKGYESLDVKNLRFGYNHRFHRNVRLAKKLVDSGEIGPLMFIRGHYGHGGRPGYDKEWRAKHGEFVDQGVHLIDLAQYLFCESLNANHVSTKSYYWNMINDNAFMSLETESGKTAFLSVSCTEWRNTFSLDIYGETGKIIVYGLGGSYGTEKVEFCKMIPGKTKPEVIWKEFLDEDDSWEKEWKAFKNNSNQCANYEDAKNIFNVIEWR